MQRVFTAELYRDQPAADQPEWLEAARRGEPRALEQLYREYAEVLHALCFRMLGRSEDAEDAVQATFVRAFGSLAGFRGDSSLKTWLYRVAVNESVRLMRRRRDTTSLLEEEAAADPAPADTERLAVRAALLRLGPEHRAILVLRFWEGLEYAEIARVLRISMPAVKMRLHRARRDFRRHYEETP